MRHVEYEISDFDEDDEVTLTLGVRTNEPELLKKLKRALRTALDEETPELKTFPEKDK